VPQSPRRGIGPKSISEFFGYVISQCAGAVVAALVVCFVVGGTFAPAPAATASVAAAFLVEVLYTFALALVVLHPVASPRRHGHSFYGLAIGFAIVVAAFAGGPISGGAFNPAVRFGPIVVATLLGGGSHAHLWIHIVAALSGGALAAAAFGLQEREAVKLHAEPSRTPESGPAA
jgi:aquaporin Z